MQNILHLFLFYWIYFLPLYQIINKMVYKRLVATLLLASTLKMSRYTFKTEYDVMNYLFAVIGNGFDWVGGRLTSDELSKFPIELDDLARTLTQDPSFNQVLIRLGVGNLTPTIFNDMNINFEVYPMSQSSLISHIPDDIDPDYADALERFIKATSELNSLTPTDKKVLLGAQHKLDKLNNNIAYGNS